MQPNPSSPFIKGHDHAIAFESARTHAAAAQAAESALSSRIRRPVVITPLPPLVRLTNVNDLSDYLRNGGDANRTVSEAEISAFVARVLGLQYILLRILFPLVYWMALFALWLGAKVLLKPSAISEFLPVWHLPLAGVLMLLGCFNSKDIFWGLRQIRLRRVVNKAGMRNWTLLHVVCFCRGTNVTFDRPKNAPFTDASRGEKSVRLLLQFGVDPSKRTVGGYSPEDMLMGRAFSPDIMEMLHSGGGNELSLANSDRHVGSKSP